MATLTVMRMDESDDKSPPKVKLGRPNRSDILTPANALFASQLQADGHSYDEIAEQLKCGKTSVMKLLQMARQLDGQGIEAQNVTLMRTGQSPLAFRGRLRTQKSSELIQTKPGKPNPHFWVISVYEVEPAADPQAKPVAPHGSKPVVVVSKQAQYRFVVEIVYHKNYKGTTFEHHSAIVTDNVAATVAGYKPLDKLAGYPPGDRFASQQRQLEEACERQYAELVSQVLMPFPEQIP